MAGQPVAEIRDGEVRMVEFGARIPTYPMLLTFEEAS